MDRPRLIRGLRIAVSTVCGFVCVLLIGLWVRSYSSSVFLVAPFFQRGSVILESSQGRVAYGFQSGALLVNGMTGSLWGIHHKSLDEWQPFTPPIATRPAFRISKSQGIDFVIAPYWILMLTSIVGVIAPWLPWQFSLRTLLIATTLIAVLLATGAYLSLW